MALYSTHTGNKSIKHVRNTLLMLVLLLFALATLFPIYFMIISSFGDPVEAGALSYSLWPAKISLASYRFFFEYSEHSYRWLLNSLIVAASVMVTNVAFATLAGYAFSKIRFRGRALLFSLLLCAMMIPYQVIQVPLYILIVNIFRIENTYSALILPGLVTVYNIFLAKQFMSSIPGEILECAKVEGCNQWQIFTKIIMPLSKTVMAVMAILTFMDSWNTFFWPFLVTNTMDMQTIQVGLKNFRFANTTYFAPMMAGAAISAVPMFILFFSLQKYFLEGVTVGAVKG
ncbi:MAG: carbohydrate ABC transporter permease [Paenibacillus macerans]|uniref:ABC transporter permease subunit n=1 Tax=Paenibacillus macerans TaxID=44252 RepID=A0A090YTE3_PAEMA|nr:carbohydrate ABC transporter permease [Paenibacillus macerans]KFM95390.1 binding--dependent transport system inner membrane component family protein [Paenibacillus macerans]MBS5912761.1 carbohydrate ABC transporter permease [Paenibacillus macerans]MCY7558030.1 carbohydrate ABC transporter permease [Paenibacillus macerans]MDU7474479.1 carbohydrate ABC transporter permease [Paenibacillus macerans]MEC0135331.1 carbohydrate ABC transporter permease [Paenibacillus macerans]